MTFLEFLSTQKELYQRCILRVCHEFSLTSTELSILLFLANNPQYNTAKQIVEKRHLAKSHVSISLRSLEERGFLKREYRNGDHRTVYIVLLPASAEAIEKGKQAQNDNFDLLLRGFSPEERNRLYGFMDRIYANASDALTKTES